MQLALKIAERVCEAVGTIGFGAATLAQVSTAETWSDMIREGGMAAIVAILLGGSFWIIRQLVANWIEEQQHSRTMAVTTVQNNTKLTELVDDLKDTLKEHGRLLHAVLEHQAAVAPAVNRIEERQKQTD